MNLLLGILKPCYLNMLFPHFLKIPETVPTYGIFTFKWVFIMFNDIEFMIRKNNFMISKYWLSMESVILKSEVSRFIHRSGYFRVHSYVHSGHTEGL